MTGLGGSILAHVLIIAIAVLTPLTGSRKVVPNPFWTVNLVTMQEISGGMGLQNGGGSPKIQAKDGVKGDEGGRSASSRPRSKGPLVPVKRLQIEEPTARVDTEIKKLDAPETPKVATSTQANMASVEKSLEKLITKPKPAPKPAPVTQEAQGEEDKGRGATKDSAKTGGQDSSSSGQGVSKGGTGGGTQAGSGSGGERGNLQSGSATGGEGAAVSVARRLYYTEIWNAVRRQWALPEFLKTQKLETILIITVRRDGKVIDMRVERSSGNDIYDESAKRAVRKAEPLPPFPSIYSPAQEEIGLRFRPEDLS